MRTILGFIMCIIIAKSSFADDVPVSVEQNDIITSITAALNSGNHEELAKYFNVSLDLVVPDNQGTFSKAQAKQIIKDFFNNNPVESYTMLQTGSSSPNSTFVIGVLTLKNQMQYRVYYLLRKDGTSSAFFIQQFQIDKQ